MKVLVVAHRRSVFGLRKHTLDSFYLFGPQKRVVFDQPAARLVNNLCVALPVAQSLKAQNDLILSPLSDESRHTATMTLISRFSQALVQCV